MKKYKVTIIHEHIEIGTIIREFENIEEMKQYILNSVTIECQRSDKYGNEVFLLGSAEYFSLGLSDK